MRTSLMELSDPSMQERDTDALRSSERLVVGCGSRCRFIPLLVARRKEELTHSPDSLRPRSRDGGLFVLEKRRQNGLFCLILLHTFPLYDFIRSMIALTIHTRVISTKSPVITMRNAISA